MLNSSSKYWTSRNSFNNSMLLIKKFLFKHGLAKPLLSIRYGDEVYIAEMIREYKKKMSISAHSSINILDVGCGAGVDIAFFGIDHYYGVDIDGFPREVAIEKGYHDARNYGVNLQIPYKDNSFHVALIIDVNAHINEKQFLNILTEISRVLKKDGLVIIVAELNNSGISYNYFRTNSPKLYYEFIEAMDHINNQYEIEFDQSLNSGSIVILHKKILIGQLLPLIHYFFYFKINTTSKLFKFLSIFIDVLLSFADQLINKFVFGKKNKSFLVAYVCKLS